MVTNLVKANSFHFRLQSSDNNKFVFIKIKLMSTSQSSNTAGLLPSFKAAVIVFSFTHQK